MTLNLRTKTIQGLKWSGISAISVSVLQLAIVVILSRLLAPEDFGLMAIMMVVIGFSQSFMDMGISNAIIHRQNITHSQLSSLYWLNVFSGIALTLVVWAVAPLIAQFYEEPRMTGLLRLLSTIFIFVAIGNQYRILCQKEMQFGLMAFAEITGSVAAVLVAVLSALYKPGVESLIYGVLAQAIISSMIFLVIGLRHHHRPGLSYKHHELGGFISFGLFQMGEKSANYFNAQLDILIMGKLLGPGPTGIYYVAKTLVMRAQQVINMIVTKVTVALMSKIQEDEESLREIYRRTVHYIALSVFPVFAAVALLAPPIIHVAFGDKWSGSIPILAILSFYYLLRVIGNPVGSLLISKGRADMGFYLNIILFVLVGPAVFIGSYWGGIGVALSLVILQILLLYPGWRYIIWPLCNLPLKDYMRAIGRPFLLTAIAVLCSAGFTVVEDEILKIALVLPVGAAVYFALLWRFEREYLLDLREGISSLWRRA